MDIEKFDRKMSDALIRKLTRKQAKNFIRTGKDYNSENNVELEKAGYGTPWTSEKIKLMNNIEKTEKIICC